MKELTKMLLIAGGTLCVVLGALGMVLPLLPTTPFLLLAAVCYGRSSERFYQRLISNRWFGKYLRNYREGRGIPLKQKVITILTLWGSILLSIVFLSTPVWSKFLLMAIAAGVSIYLIRLKTMREEEVCEAESN
jgi:uncharacterized membrane protein YbaN (DUF454 family)